VDSSVGGAEGVGESGAPLSADIAHGYHTEARRVKSRPRPRRFDLSIYSPGRTRTLDSHASRLRQKLAVGSDRPWIVNVWGHGYRVCTPE
jgi:DNA-binding response OmpR family regulator